MWRRDIWDDDGVSAGGLSFGSNPQTTHSISQDEMLARMRAQRGPDKDNRSNLDHKIWAEVSCHRIPLHICLRSLESSQVARLQDGDQLSLGRWMEAKSYPA